MKWMHKEISVPDKRDSLLTSKALHSFLVLYLGLIFLWRAFAYPSLLGDDAEQVLFAQSGFLFGYHLPNPILPTWLVIISEHIFGINAASVVLVKFIFFGFIFFFQERLARVVLKNETAIIAATLSPLAIYYFAWDSVRTYTHSIMLLAAMLATVYVFYKITETKRLIWYAVFGVVIGLGLLAKYNYALFLLCFVAAALFESSYRRSLGNWAVVLSVLVALVIAGPHGLWLLDQRHLMGDVTVQKFQIQSEISWLLRSWLGMRAWGEAVISFVLPLAALLVLFFPKAFVLKQRDATDVAKPSGRLGRLMERYLLIVLVVTAGMVLASGTTRVRIHYMFLLFLLPLWAFYRIEAANYTDRALKRYIYTVLSLAMIVPVALVITFVTEPRFNKWAPLNLPYAEIAHQLRSAGFIEGTVYAHNYPYFIAGDLRLQFPNSRFLSVLYPQYMPPAHDRQGQCLVIWNSDGGVKESSVVPYAEKIFNLDSESGERGSIKVPYTNGDGRMASFSYRLWPAGSGTCR